MSLDSRITICVSIEYDRWILSSNWNDFDNDPQKFILIIIYEQVNPYTYLSLLEKFLKFLIIGWSTTKYELETKI